jgi:hypothetical protein
MDIITIPQPIIVYCLNVSPFPAAIKPAYDTLHQLYPPGNGRTYFGISWPDGKSGLIYKAATSLADTDGPPTDERFTPFEIRDGRYISSIIRNFMTDTQAIRKCFAEMIARTDIAPDGYCVEMYLNPTDVQCMVPLK